MKLDIVMLEGDATHCTKGLVKLTSILSLGIEFTIVAFVLGEEERLQHGEQHEKF